MKKYILFFCGIISFITVSAQLNIDAGATLFIQPGVKVTVQGDVTSNADIQGGGTLLMKGSTLQNINMNGKIIPNLEIDNPAHVTLATGNAEIGTSLLMTSGRLKLGNQNLRLSSASVITGYNNTSFIETNGSGVLTKAGLGSTAFTFPVGYSGTEYNPLTVSNAGTADDISIVCMPNVLTNGLTGTPVPSDFANNSWVISEAVAGGSNFSLTAEWTGTDELPGFNRAKSGVAKYNTLTDWDLPANLVLAAAGTGPYTISRSNILAPGVFAVAGANKVNRASFNIKVFLQGAYTGSGGGVGAGIMRDSYRSLGVLPLTQPYGGGKFTHLGVQGGTETINPSVLSVTGNDAIIDWVFVTLHDAATPTTKYQTRAALLQKDGDVVDLDGVSPVSMPINSDGNYSISVGHRNHLSVRLPNASPMNLVENAAPATWDFTTGSVQAYSDPAITTNLPMIAVTNTGNTKYCMIGGNTDGVSSATINGRRIIYSGSGNDRGPILNTGLGGNASTTTPITAINFAAMARYDLTMNGSIVYSGSGNDPLIILNALGGNTSITATEHQ